MFAEFAKLTDQDAFLGVIAKLAKQYPHAELKVVSDNFGGMYVEAYGETRFSISGYNFLYNVKRLCDLLENELA